MPSKPLPLLILYGALTGLLLAAMALVPVAYLAVPFILAAVSMAHGEAVSISAALFGALVAALMIGMNSAIVLLLLAPAGILMSVIVKKKWSSFGCVALTAGVTCAALLVMISYFYPDGIGARLLEYRDELFDQLSVMIQAGMLSAEQADAMKAIWIQGFETLEIVLPGMIIAYSMLASLIAYLICRKSAKKRGVELAPFPPFASWRLPKGFGLGAVILIIGIFVLPSFYESTALAFALEVTLSIPLLVLGMCVVEYFLARTKIPKAGRVALIAAAAMFAYYPVLFVGVFDQAFMLRQRIDKNQDTGGK